MGNEDCELYVGETSGLPIIPLSTSPVVQGKFLAVSPNSLAYSYDGLTWNKTTNPHQDMTNIVFAGNKFFGFHDVASEDASSSYYYSIDGINWFTSEFNFTYTSIGSINYTIIYGNGVYLLIHSQGLYYSLDGIQWFRSNLTDSSWNVIFGNGRFVLSTRNGTYWSLDGINWTKSSQSISVRGIGFSNGVFFSNMTSNIQLSSDGDVWNSGSRGNPPTYRNILSYYSWTFGDFSAYFHQWNNQFNIMKYDGNGCLIGPCGNSLITSYDKTGPIGSNDKVIYLPNRTLDTETDSYKICTNTIDMPWTWIDGFFPSLENWTSITYGEI